MSIFQIFPKKLKDGRYSESTGPVKGLVSVFIKKIPFGYLNLILKSFLKMQENVWLQRRREYPTGSYASAPFDKINQNKKGKTEKES